MQQFNNTPLNLELLAEECAEVIQAKSKLIRFGLNHTNPIKGHAAISDLEDEIGDLEAIIAILKNNNTISGEAVENAKQRKLVRLNNWYDTSACDRVLPEEINYKLLPHCL